MTSPAQVDRERDQETEWLNWIGLYSKNYTDDFIEHTLWLIYQNADVRDAFLKLTGDWFEQDCCNRRKYG